MAKGERAANFQTRTKGKKQPPASSHHKRAKPRKRADQPQTIQPNRTHLTQSKRTPYARRANPAHPTKPRETKHPKQQGSYFFQSLSNNPTRSTRRLTAMQQRNSASNKPIQPKTTQANQRKAKRKKTNCRRRDKKREV